MKVSFEGSKEELFQLGTLLHRLRRIEERKAKANKDADYLDLIAKGQFIQAIKLHRERNNSGLKESKEYMDALRDASRTAS